MEEGNVFFPEICSSWHLQAATIPIGANVSVGIFIPPSVIKILLLHCILGVSFDQLHSIKVMDHLMVVAYYKVSLMVYTCWSIFTNSSHLQSFFSTIFAKVIFRVLGLIRSRVLPSKSCKSSIMVSRHMRRSIMSQYQKFQ